MNTTNTTNSVQANIQRCMLLIGKLVDNHGRVGTLISVDRDGWVTVDFANGGCGFPLKVGANAVVAFSTIERTNAK